MKFIPDTEFVLITNNWKQISPKSLQMVDRFYYLLFNKHPQLQSLFVHSPYRQNLKFRDMMTLMVSHLEKPEVLSQLLYEAGQRHIKYGVQEAYYPLVGACLLQAITEASGDFWNEDLENAWKCLLEKIVHGMNHR